MLRRGAAASTYWAFTRRVHPRVDRRLVNGTPPAHRSWRSLRATAKNTQRPTGKVSGLWEASPWATPQMWAPPRPRVGKQIPPRAVSCDQRRASRSVVPARPWGGRPGGGICGWGPGAGGEPCPRGRFQEGGLCCSGVLCFRAFLSSCRCRFRAARPWLTEGLSVSPQDTGRARHADPAALLQLPTRPSPPVCVST